MRRRDLLKLGGGGLLLSAGPALAARRREVVIRDSRFIAALPGQLDCAVDAGQLWHRDLSAMVADRPVFTGITGAADMRILAELAHPHGYRLRGRAAYPGGNGLIRWILS